MQMTKPTAQSTSFRLKWVGLVVGLALALTACSTGGPTTTVLDVAGPWAGTATTVGECAACGLMFDLQQTGTTVSGTARDSHNDVTIDVSGSIVGDKLTLTHTGTGGNTIVHEGVVSNNTITGTIAGENSAGTVLDGTFTVNRGLLNVAGTWTGTAAAAGELTFNLQQSEIAVTGTARDHLNDVTINVAGSLIGNALTLTHTGTGGNSLVHEGVVEGNTITGTIEGKNSGGVDVSTEFTVTRD